MNYLFLTKNFHKNESRFEYFITCLRNPVDIFYQQLEQFNLFSKYKSLVLEEFVTKNEKRSYSKQ